MAKQWAKAVCGWRASRVGLAGSSPQLKSSASRGPVLPSFPPLLPARAGVNASRVRLRWGWRRAQTPTRPLQGRGSSCDLAQPCELPSGVPSRVRAALDLEHTKRAGPSLRRLPWFAAHRPPAVARVGPAVAVSSWLHRPATRNDGGPLQHFHTEPYPHHQRAAKRGQSQAELLRLCEKATGALSNRPAARAGAPPHQRQHRTAADWPCSQRLV